MQSKQPLSDYLQRHAEPLAQTLAATVPSTLAATHCIVIPAYNETADFLERIKTSPLSQLPLLLIVIVNQPEDDDDTHLNQQLWNNITHSGKIISNSSGHVVLCWPNTRSYLLAINCFTEGKKLPRKQGVGLARKLGCDIACACIANNRLTSRWIHTTDADTHLPDNYLSQLPTANTISALIYPFTHSASDNSEITQATLLYEQSLHHYVKGLAYAGSPYAFHTLGSCIAVSAQHYTQARGFPKRAGGEDFYLLNKLAKLGEIKQQPTTLTISARASQRTSFGTGPAVKKIIEQGYKTHNYPCYNRDIFRHLKNLLVHFDQLFDYKNNEEEWLALLAPEVSNTLAQLGIEKLFEHLRSQIKNKQQAKQHIHEWFDGFRTLKTVHILEEYYPKQVLAQQQCSP
jgi:hypothetical protein